MTPPAEGERAREIVRRCMHGRRPLYDELREFACVDCIAAALRTPQPRGLTGDVVRAAEALADYVMPLRDYQTVLALDKDAYQRLVDALTALRALNLSAIEGAPAAGEREGLDVWQARVAALWPFDAATYPELVVDERAEAIRHVALHQAKDAGRIAAAIEPHDHGRPIDDALLRRATRNALVNTLRLCALLGLSATALLQDYADEHLAPASPRSAAPECDCGTNESPEPHGHAPGCASRRAAPEDK